MKLYNKKYVHNYICFHVITVENVRLKIKINLRHFVPSVSYPSVSYFSNPLEIFLKADSVLDVV